MADPVNASIVTHFQTLEDLRIERTKKHQLLDSTLTRLNRITNHVLRITNGKDGKTRWSRVLSKRLVQGAFTTRTVARHQQRVNLLTSLPHGDIRGICGQFSVFKCNELQLKSRRHVDPLGGLQDASQHSDRTDHVVIGQDEHDRRL